MTVIGADGTVLAESDRETVREMENHAGRPEVRQALAGAVGSDVRRSASLGRDLLYVAVPLEREGRRQAVSGWRSRRTTSTRRAPWSAGLSSAGRSWPSAWRS